MLIATKVQERLRFETDPSLRTHSPEGLEVLVRGDHGGVVDGEGADVGRGGHRAEDVHPGPVRLLPQQEVEEAQLEDVVRQRDVPALQIPRIN